MTNLNRIRVVVLGSSKVGKSAVTVRYLTKRYIGEYSSTTDFMYRHSVTFDSVTTEVEILDTCKCAFSTECVTPALPGPSCREDSSPSTAWAAAAAEAAREPLHCYICPLIRKPNPLTSLKATGCLYDHIRWGEAFVVVYSICDMNSFNDAHTLLDKLSKLKLPSYYTTLLLGNKRDLDHSRAVCVDAGQELSLRYSCQYYEVSAAESFAGVSLAFQSLLREARSVQLLRAMPIRRKLGVNSVSKVLGTIFGKNSNKRDRKKRPSLSI